MLNTNTKISLVRGHKEENITVSLGWCDAFYVESLGGGQQEKKSRTSSYDDVYVCESKKLRV